MTTLDEILAKTEQRKKIFAKRAERNKREWYCDICDKTMTISGKYYHKLSKKHLSIELQALEVVDILKILAPECLD